MILTALFLKAKLYILTLPFVFTMAGAGMNQAVFAANGGKFPVMLNDRAAVEWKVDKAGFIDDRHYRMTDQTHLNFLADYINLGGAVIESPGDVLIEIGEVLGEYALTVWLVIIVMELNRRVAAEK